MTSESILAKEFEDIKFDLIKKHRELGMEASGRWINSLEVVQERLSVKILGADYTYELVNGREPGEMQPVSMLQRWVEDKGIARGKEATGIALAIAKKIAKEGTRYYKQGGTNLIDDVITPERIQKIIDKVGLNLVMEATSTFSKLMKQNVTT